VLAALVQHHLDERSARCRRDHLEPVDAHDAVLELDPVAQPTAKITRDRSLHLGQIGLRHAMRRVGQSLRQLAVVGEQQQPLGVGVEAPDVEEPLLATSQVIPHARPTAVVGHGRLDPPRLVEREHDVPRSRRDAHAVDLDDGRPGVDPQALLEHDPTVDLDPAFVDHLFAGPPASDPCGCQHLLKSDLCVVVISRHDVSIST
jgi:hypothetical protein